MDWITITPLLITAGVPILIAGLKLAANWIPGWMLPIIAPILGGALDAGIAWATGHAANPLAGALLGSAGVGVREIVDQLRQQAAPKSP